MRVNRTCQWVFRIFINIYEPTSLFFIQPERDSNEVYLLSLAVECGLALAKLVSRRSDDVHMDDGGGDGGEDDDDGDETDDDEATNPALTLADVATLLAPLLRQTALARFPTVGRAPSGSSCDNLTVISSSMSYSTALPVLTEAEWEYVHASEAPAVGAWWAAIKRRLPSDAAFVTACGAGVPGASLNGGIFDVPGVCRQIEQLVQSAEAMSSHAFNLRFSARHECCRAAHLSALLCGMC